MSPESTEPREADEWRVEVELENEEHGSSLGDRLRALSFDDNARKRLGGSVIVTRDGSSVFLYAWHEPSATEAERVVRDLMEQDKLAGQVNLMRWHPVAEQWRPADEPLPESESELRAEEHVRAEQGRREREDQHAFPWEVVIDVPRLRDVWDVAGDLEERGLPVKRRWKYLLIGVDTEDAAVELGRELQTQLPEGSHIGIRGNPDTLPHPVFTQLGNLEPGALRDLGL